MDREDVSDNIQTQWEEARANRIMQFKVGDYKDSIRMSTGTLKEKILFVRHESNEINILWHFPSK